MVWVEMCYHVKWLCRLCVPTDNKDLEIGNRHSYVRIQRHSETMFASTFCRSELPNQMLTDSKTPKRTVNRMLEFLIVKRRWVPSWFSACFYFIVGFFFIRSPFLCRSAGNGFFLFKFTSLDIPSWLILAVSVNCNSHDSGSIRASCDCVLWHLEMYIFKYSNVSRGDHALISTYASNKSNQSNWSAI